MEDLQRTFLAIQAVRDCPSVARLILDIWLYAQKRGESDGLRLAAVLLAGVKVYTEHEKRMRLPLFTRMGKPAHDHR